MSSTMPATVVAFKLTPALWLFLDTVAVFRLTRLVTTDTITEKPRQWVKRHWGMGAFDFVVCPWCTSIWLAAGVVLLTVFAPHQWQYVAYVLVCSAVAGVLAEHS
jgi:hypothetical protein